MSTRRLAREAALQFLFQEDFTVAPGQPHCHDLEERFTLFSSLFQVNRKGRDYALELLRGIAARLPEIDALIADCARNWRMTRIAAIDRNLMRIAIYEMMREGGVPYQVAINEAVEIAKKFASDDSPKFINGVLDAAHLRLAGD